MLKFNIEYITNKPWYIEWLDDEGFLHKEDGPAKEYVGGHKFWYIHGVQVTKRVVELLEHLIDG